MKAYDHRHSELLRDRGQQDPAGAVICENDIRFDALQRSIQHFSMEVLLLAEKVTADRALAMGLVNRVVPRDRVMSTARELAATICKNGPLAVRACKRSAKESTFLGLTEALENEMSYSASVFGSDDAKEGIKAFKEKRDPVWTGR